MLETNAPRSDRPIWRCILKDPGDVAGRDLTILRVTSDNERVKERASFYAFEKKMKLYYY